MKKVFKREEGNMTLRGTMKRKMANLAQITKIRRRYISKSKMRKIRNIGN